MASDILSIGTLARRTGCTVPTIRYYEEIGLLPRATRQAGGHRIYGEADRSRLQFIRRCRDFGFSIEEVRGLVSLSASPGQDCTAVRNMAQAHLDQVREKVRELRALETSLRQFVDGCDTLCAGGPVKDCVILADIAERPTKGCCAAPSPAMAAAESAGCKPVPRSVRQSSASR